MVTVLVLLACLAYSMVAGGTWAWVFRYLHHGPPNVDYRPDAQAIATFAALLWPVMLPAMATGAAIIHFTIKWTKL